jgi:hypothetical protein
MAKWNYEFNGHNITVENNPLSELLYVDGQIAAQHKGLGFSSSLTATLPEGQTIEAKLQGTVDVNCDLSIDGKLQYPVSKE